MATAMKRAADFGADAAATFGRDACNTAQNPANKVPPTQCMLGSRVYTPASIRPCRQAAKHASSLVPAVTVEAKKKRAPKKVANVAPNSKCVSEGIDEDAYEAPKAAHARPQYRTHVKNIDEVAHEAPKAAHARPQYRTHVKNIGEVAHEAPKAAHARPQYRTHVKKSLTFYKNSIPLAKVATA
ncbi:hypothetical protein M885DRAFT_591530 [Pelagophyceae sp. CCMP2097]|nr:hypothetical protein M885DRAFT_591530 [Pelagophyceae sp. CCMP2097]